LGINIYKRTDNLSESELRAMPLARECGTGDESLKACREYLVPLHDYNKAYTAVSTGLVRVQPEGFSNATVAWFQTLLKDAAYPPILYPTHSTFLAANGCSLSQGANRTYTLAAADYFLETLGATGDGGCGYFNIRYAERKCARTTDARAGAPVPGLRVPVS